MLNKIFDRSAVQASVFFCLVSLFCLDMMYVLEWVGRPALWITDLTLVFMGFSTLLYCFKLRSFPKNFINFFLIIILIQSLAALAMGGVSFSQLIFGLRQSLKFVLVFYAILTFDFEEVFLIRLIKFCLLLTLLCAPTAAIERYYMKLSEDIAGGLIIGGSFAVFGIFIVCLTIAYCMQFGWLRWEFLVLVSVFLTLMMSESKAAYMIILPALLIQIWPEVWKRNFKAVGKMFLVLGLIYGLSFKFAGIFSASMGSDLPRIFKVDVFWGSITRHSAARFYKPGEKIETPVVKPVEKAVDKTKPQEPKKLEVAKPKPKAPKKVEVAKPKPTNDQKPVVVAIEPPAPVVKAKPKPLSRVNAILFAWDYIKKDWRVFLFGEGAGFSSDSYFSGSRGNSDIVGLALHFIQLAKSLVEFGVIGTLLFIGVFVAFFIRSIFIIRHDSPFWRATATGFQGSLVAFLICMSYAQVWVLKPVAFLIWFLAGCMELRRQKLLFRNSDLSNKGSPL